MNKNLFTLEIINRFPEKIDSRNKLYTIILFMTYLYYIVVNVLMINITSYGAVEITCLLFTRLKTTGLKKNV